MATNVVADAFIPEVWDASVQRTNEANLVAKQICRRLPSNLASKLGDQVHFPALADPTVNLTYSGTATYEDLVSSEVTMLIDKTYYTAFKVGDLDEIMANVGLKDSQDQRCGYMMQKSIDTALLGLYTNALMNVTDTSCDTATILSDIIEVYVAAQNVNLRDGNIFLVVPPWVEGKLALAGVKFQIKNGTEAANGVKWTNVNGVDLYVSTQVPNTNTAAAPVSQCLFGSYDAICFHQLGSKSYALRDVTDPTMNYISNFNYWGAKVVRPDLLGVCTLTYTAETAI